MNWIVISNISIDNLDYRPQSQLSPTVDKSTIAFRLAIRRGWNHVWETLVWVKPNTDIWCFEFVSASWQDMLQLFDWNWKDEIITLSFLCSLIRNWGGGFSGGNPRYLFFSFHRSGLQRGFVFFQELSGAERS